MRRSPIFLLTYAQYRTLDWVIDFWQRYQQPNNASGFCARYAREVLSAKEIRQPKVYAPRSKPTDPHWTQYHVGQLGNAQLVRFFRVHLLHKEWLLIPLYSEECKGKHYQSYRKQLVYRPTELGLQLYCDVFLTVETLKHSEDGIRKIEIWQRASLGNKPLHSINNQRDSKNANASKIRDGAERNSRLRARAAVP